MLQVINCEIEESIATRLQLKAESLNEIAEAATVIVISLRTGGKLMAFGNGGSAADAQHFVAELVGG